MLARVHRLTEGREFATAIRGGRRAGSATIVAHLAVADGGPGALPRVGVVVGKVVGGAVTRNRVKRRLRHLVRERLHRLPDDSLLVIRARPAAADTSSAALAADLDRVLSRLSRAVVTR